MYLKDTKWTWSYMKRFCPIYRSFSSAGVQHSPHLNRGGPWQSYGNPYVLAGRLRFSGEQALVQIQNLFTPIGAGSVVLQKNKQIPQQEEPCLLFQGGPCLVLQGGPSKMIPARPQL